MLGVPTDRIPTEELKRIGRNEDANAGAGVPTDRIPTEELKPVILRRMRYGY